MGKYFFDQYSILHMASGVLAFFWGLSFKQWFWLHILFEVVENTQYGMNFINNYLTMWPGGKPEADSLLNSVGDQVFGMIGWIIANELDKIYK